VRAHFDYVALVLLALASSWWAYFDYVT